MTTGGQGRSCPGPALRRDRLHDIPVAFQVLVVVQMFDVTAVPIVEPSTQLDFEGDVRFTGHVVVDHVGVTRAPVVPSLPLQSAGMWTWALDRCRLTWRARAATSASVMTS